MKNLILLFIVFASTSVSALEYRTPSEVCRRIQDPSIRSQCLDLAYYGATFDGFACDVCDRLESATLTVDCLNEVRSRTFQYAALEVCDSMISARKTVECIKAVAWKTYYSYEIRHCQSFYTDEAKLRCLKS